MKSIVFFALPLSLIFLLSCNKNKNHSQIIVIQYSIDNLKGNGDTVEIGYLNDEGKFLQRKFRFGTLENGFEKTYFYDSSGKEISLESNYNNQHVYRTDRTIDRFGTDVEVKTYELGKVGDTSIHVYLNKYNSDSSILISNIFSKGDTAIKEVNEDLYDFQKHLLQRIIKDPVHNNIITNIEKYKYDKYGNNISSFNQNFPDSIITEGTYFYDKKRNLLKESHLKNGQFEFETTYTYKNGKRIEGIKITSDKSKYLLKYFYE